MVQLGQINNRSLKKIYDGSCEHQEMKVTFPLGEKENPRGVQSLIQIYPFSPIEKYSEKTIVYLLPRTSLCWRSKMHLQRRIGVDIMEHGTDISETFGISGVIGKIVRMYISMEKPANYRRGKRAVIASYRDFV